MVDGERAPTSFLRRLTAYLYLTLPFPSLVAFISFAGLLPTFLQKVLLSTVFLFCFRMGLHFVTTGWIVEIGLSENSFKQPIKCLYDSSLIIAVLTSRQGIHISTRADKTIDA